MKLGINLPLCLLIHICGTVAVDKGNFKTCDQSSFCKRHRNVASDDSPYIASSNSVEIRPTSLHLQLLNTRNNIPLVLDLFGLKENTLRLKINEVNPIRPRYEVPIGDVVVEEPKQDRIDVVQRDSSQIVLQFNESKIIIHFVPFRIDVLIKDEPSISINGRGLLMFEHLRLKKQQQGENKGEEQNENKEEEGGEQEEEKKPDEQNDDEVEGMWEESFKSHHDSKPFGPSSVGIDFAFPGYEFVYGIPEHADTLALKSTKGTDPYRLFNLDVFEYEVGNPMALYGSVPVMLAHNEKRTLGLFWLNAAETWIDIGSNIADKNMFSKLVDFVKGDKDIPQIDTHWFSESGIIDVFMMLGPKPTDVFKQYAKLTGTTPLPPLFALGYHQSRWNYNDEQDVANINAGFDEHDIPLDVIWLDIEHTDGKRYFTWDHMRFPTPEEMINNLTAKGRKLVAIVDPHIKRDDGYHIYREGRDLGYFVKTKDGNDYEGWCWPGSSVWFDFINPEIRKFWASKFSLTEYKGSTLDLFTWNDMNEPSVFNGPEITMYKDARHFGDWENRDVHNIFGLYVHQSTIEGQLLRSENQHRPFVLSRAFFAGSQRFGAVWTGDNTGEWSHLKISLPMVLSLNIVGLTFSGADVGGFFKNPDAELLSRWYQAAAFQPFFRAHAHLDTRRREPWLYTSEHMKAIRQAIRVRYLLLPYWYTLFFNAERDGGPIVKPLWVEFPAEKATFSIEDGHMLGSAILVHPVTDIGSVGVNVYLPGPDQLWYDIDTYKMYSGGNNLYQTVDLQKIPVYLRGGFIIPVHERIRRAAILSAHDPYTLLIILDKQGQAKGDLYHDDFYTFDYKKGQYIHREFIYANNKLTSRNLNDYQFPTDVWIERIQIIGIQNHLKNIRLTAPGLAVAVESTYNAEKKLLTIRKPGVKITADFEISLK